MNKKPVCPKCGSGQVLKIVYGLFKKGMEIDETKYYIGGCCIDPDKKWHCKNCDHEFPSILKNT